MSRRSRTWFWVAVAGALLVTVAGAATAATGLVIAARPDTSVKAYFAKLQDGDAAGALATGTVPVGDRRFLTHEVLSEQIAAGRIEALDVHSTARHGDSATVDVRYELVGAATRTEVADRIAVVRDGPRWRLRTSAVLVTPAPSRAANRLAMAGATLPTSPYLMLPGALPATTNSALLEVNRSAAVVRFATAPSALAVPVQIPDAGRAAISAALDAGLANCLASGTGSQCALTVPGVRYVPNSIGGTITTPPSAGPPQMTIGPEPEGLIRVNGTFVLAATWKQLNFNNIEVAQSGQLTLAYAASLAADVPVVIQWGTAP